MLKVGDLNVAAGRGKAFLLTYKNKMKPTRINRDLFKRLLFLLLLWNVFTNINIILWGFHKKLCLNI